MIIGRTEIYLCSRPLLITIYHGGCCGGGGGTFSKTAHRSRPGKMYLSPPSQYKFNNNVGDCQNQFVKIPQPLDSHHKLGDTTTRFTCRLRPRSSASDLRPQINVSLFFQCFSNKPIPILIIGIYKYEFQVDDIHFV